jgi:protein-S-isoprenylcysteine O-methyltransferase Ste14
MLSHSSERLEFNTPSSAGRLLAKRMIFFVVLVVLLGGPMFLAAGRLDWWAGWLFLGAYAGGGMVATVVVGCLNPEVIQARERRREGTKQWDRVLLRVYVLTILLAIIVAGLDAGRFGWSPPVPPVLQIGAVVLLEVSQSLSAWAAGVNAHFETTVRIQDDRRQQVCTSGPYRFVRHPGYLGYIVTWVSAPLIMGSWWALVPAGLSGVLFVVRTALEDRTLREELPGYAEYAQRVRYRLVPGVW